MRCPNINDDRIKCAMNAIIESYGGAPMSETEFRSSHESSKREGSDKIAMNSMYKLYDMVPSDSVDNFIDRILHEYVQSNPYSLSNYLNSVYSNPLDISNYDVPASITGASIFGISDEKIDLVDNDPLLLDTTTIGEYLGVEKSSELILKLNNAGYRTYSEIPVGASVRSVRDFVFNNVFSIDLIPESMRSEFLAEAKAEIKGGSSNSIFSDLFRKIGKRSLEEFVHSNYYIGSNRTIVHDGKVLGSFSIDDKGVFEMDDSLIVPFVRINSGSKMIINSTNQSIVKELNDIGFKSAIIDRELVVLEHSEGIAQSVDQARESLDNLHIKIKEHAEKFFKNVKSSYRMSSPALSMLLDSSSMNIDELVDWISRSVKDSYGFILDELSKADEKLEFKGTDDQVFVNMHIIEDELMPFLYNLMHTLKSVNIGKEYDSYINRMFKDVNELEFRINTFTTMYANRLELDLANRYGYDIAKFNVNRGDGAKDIKPYLYIFKYAEKSSNYLVRQSVILIKDLMSKRFIEERKYTKIDKLYSKLKEHRDINPAKLYEHKVGRPGVATGFLIDDIHWGSFSDELTGFNNIMRIKYGADGMYDRTIEEEHWLSYRNEVNNWLKKNTILPMDETYLDAISKLSKDTYIQYIDSRNYLARSFSGLSGEDIANNSIKFQKFISHYKEYLSLFSFNDISGAPKRIGSKELRIADELNRFKDIFNPENTESTSTKFNDFKNVLDKKLDDNKITSSEYQKVLSAFSGYSTGSSINVNPDSEFRSAIRIHTANGMDMSAFSNASISTREMMLDIYDQNEVSNPIYSKEYYDLLKGYKKKYPTDYISKMEDSYITMSGTNGAIVNPLFYVYMSPSQDTNKPSSIFSFDSDTFKAESSNPIFDPNSPFKLQPKRELYKNEDYEKLSAGERELASDVRDILKDINENNGTISLYGPLLPQISSGFMSRGLRHAVSTYNPLQVLWYPIKTKMFYNNESLSSVIGFKKEANIPSSLYSKNSQILIDPNTISRDLTKILSQSYTDSLTNKIASGKLFAFKSIIDRAKDKRGLNTPGAASLMASMVRSFLGTEEIEGTHKSGEFNWPSLITTTIAGIRTVHLSWKWLTMTSNVTAALTVAANDNLFVRRRDLIACMPTLMKSVLDFSTNAFTRSESKETDLLSMMRLSGVEPDSTEKHTTYYGTKFGSFIAENFWFGGYRLSDVLFLTPISHSVFNNIKFYDGNFYNEYEFIDKFAKGADDGPVLGKNRRAARKKFFSINETLYNAFSFDQHGMHSLNDKYRYSNALNALEMARTIIKIKHRAVAGNKSQSFSPQMDTIFSPQVMVYKGWWVNALNDLFSNTYYDPIMKVQIESKYSSLAKIFMAGLSYLPIISEMYRYYDGENREPVDRRVLNQYQIDNGLTVVRNISALIIYQFLALAAFEAIMQSITAGLANDEKEQDMTPSKRFLLAMCTLAFRTVQEVNGTVNPLSLLDISGLTSPITSIISSIIKGTTEAGGLMNAKETLPEEMQTRIENATGKTMDEMAVEKILSFTPGGPGYLSTKRMLYDKEGASSDMFWYFKNNPFAEPMYEYIDTRVNPNSLFIKGNIENKRKQKETDSYRDGSGLKIR